MILQTELILDAELRASMLLEGKSFISHFKFIDVLTEQQMGSSHGFGHAKLPQDESPILVLAIDGKFIVQSENVLYKKL